LVVWVLTHRQHVSTGVSLSFPWISTLYPPCKQLLAAAVGCWLMWALGCHLHGCCIGVPSSWDVHWVPVLACHYSSSIMSQSPVCCPCLLVLPSFQLFSPCHSSPAWVVLCPILTFHPQLLSLALSRWPHHSIIPIPAAPCFHPASSCSWWQLGCCCAGSHHCWSLSPPLTIISLPCHWSSSPPLAVIYIPHWLSPLHSPTYSDWNPVNNFFYGISTVAVNSR